MPAATAPRGGGSGGGSRSKSRSGDDVDESAAKRQKKSSSGGKDAGQKREASVADLKRQLSSIKNKQRRQAAYQKVRQEERRVKEAERRRRQRDDDGDGDGRPAVEPHTLESLRLPDPTMTGPAGDVEVDAEEAADEFADILDPGVDAVGGIVGRTPRLLVTHADEVGKRTSAFCRCLARTVPNALFCRRRRLPMGRVLAAAKARDFTAVMIVGEHNKKPCTALLTHLPLGPTFTFRLSSVRLPRELARPPGDDKPETVQPQVLCNRFHTRLGRRVARGLAALFPAAAAAAAGAATGAPQPPRIRLHARVVTFHNQRDYVFFRHHRYMLRQPTPAQQEAAKERGRGPARPRLALQEVGPRFTLKLRSLQSGPLLGSRRGAAAAAGADGGGGGGNCGAYEWLHKRHEMEQSRRRFFL